MITPVHIVELLAYATEEMIALSEGRHAQDVAQCRRLIRSELWRIEMALQRAENRSRSAGYAYSGDGSSAEVEL